MKEFLGSLRYLFVCTTGSTEFHNISFIVLKVDLPKSIIRQTHRHNSYSYCISFTFTKLFCKSVSKSALLHANLNAKFLRARC